MTSDPSTPDPISELDISSEPFEAPRQEIVRPRSKKFVRIYFGCCRVTSQLKPPEHVIQAKSNTWRVHCPRCAGLLEVIVQ